MTKIGRDTRIEPILLLVPGLNDSGPNHWQSHWERDFENAQKVDLGMWDNPHRNTWVNKLNLAIQRATQFAGRPVVLVAHSLGCHAVSWWAEYERPVQGDPVIGALLVAPPDVEAAGVDARVARFAPVMPRRLPFRSILAASGDDPWCSFGQAKRLARTWGSRLIDVGPIGHINAESGIADWNYGKYLLRHLLAEVLPQPAPLVRSRSYDTITRHQLAKLEMGP